MAIWNSTERFVWDAPFALERIAHNLARSRRSILRLPRSCHPLLSEHLYPRTQSRKRIDLPGDAELLARIAHAAGLERLSQLVEPIRHVGARVRLRSPAPHLVFYVAASQTGAAPAERHFFGSDRDRIGAGVRRELADARGRQAMPGDSRRAAQPGAAGKKFELERPLLQRR